MTTSDIALLLAGTLAVALAVPTTTAAQPTNELPGRQAAEDLLLVETHVLEVGGEVVEDAEIYFSEYEAFYLVTSSELEEPLMVSPRGRSVQTVDAEKLERRGDVEARLDAGAARTLLGRYTLHRGVYSFEVHGREVKLRPAPPMLGRQNAEAVQARHKRYADAFRSHRLKRTDLKSLPLRKGEILVRVYFNSQDDVCRRVVPKIMKLEEALRGPAKKIRFEYYGLPERIPDDEEAKAEGIFGVPTVDVYADGKKIGRLKALALDRPEENLLPLLTRETGR